MQECTQQTLTPGLFPPPLPPPLLPQEEPLLLLQEEPVLCPYEGKQESTQGLKRIPWEPDSSQGIIICFTPLCQPPSLPISSQPATEGSYSEHKGQVWPGVFGNAGQSGDPELSSSPPSYVPEVKKPLEPNVF